MISSHSASFRYCSGTRTLLHLYHFFIIEGLKGRLPNNIYTQASYPLHKQVSHRFLKGIPGYPLNPGGAEIDWLVVMLWLPKAGHYLDIITRRLCSLLAGRIVYKYSTMYVVFNISLL